MTKTKVLLFFVVLYYNPILLGNKADKTLYFDVEINKMALKYSQEINFKKAYFYFEKKNWDSTLVYSMRQINISKKEVELNNYCHFIRALSFTSKGLCNKAKNELKLITRSFPFKKRIEITYGIIALKQNKYNQALFFFESVEQKKKDCSDYTKKVFYHNLGLCYFHTKKYAKAEKYLFKASVLQKIEKDTILLIGTYMDIANLYYEQYKDQQAIPYFKKAYQLSKKVNNFELKQNAAENMAVVEENRKNLAQALVYRKEFEQWKDSLNDQNKVWAIADIEKKYAVNQKQKEIKVLEVENKVKVAERNGFLYSSILLLGLFATAIYFYKQKVKRNKIILQQKTELDQLNATKDKLFSVVSHDLRSSVNALKTSTIKLISNLESKNYTELDSLLHQNSSIANSTYNLLDNLLNWALLQTKQMYFQQESQHLYSIVQQMEFNYKPLFLDKKIRFENTIAKDIFVLVDLDSLKIILRNLLDNAIKFSEANDCISIYTRESNDKFCNLIIEDTGLGMDNQTQQELLKDTTLLSKKCNNEVIGSGLGIQLCKSMITKNGGKLAIESQKDIGAKFIVSLLKIETDAQH